MGLCFHALREVDGQWTVGKRYRIAVVFAVLLGHCFLAMCSDLAPG